MKKIQEIQEQQNIINQNQVNMIVSASAGSGKTFVMIERVLKILESCGEEHADLDEMLILTFTNQSANEMSQRLEKKLIEKIDENPKLVEQLDLIRVCDISTIHAFCQKMLKKYFYEAKISSNFELVSEEKQRFMLRKCINRAVQQQKNNNSQDFLDLLQYFSTKRGDDDIVATVQQIYSLLENEVDDEAWIEKKSTILYSEHGKNLYEDYFNQKIISFANFFKTSFSKYIQSGICEKLKVNLCKIYNRLDEIKQNNSFEQNKQILLGTTVPSYTKKDEEGISFDALQFRERYKTRLNDLKKSMRFCSGEETANLRDRAKKMIDILLSIYEQSKTFYQNQKQKKNLLDFSDLEHKFLQLLNNPKICQNISNSYKYVFVDEFQDTNPVQMQILDKLGSTIMAVGDIKQSIYGFRGSTPQIFQDMMQKYLSGEGGVACKLNCNFRSNKDILNFANMIFSKIMTQKTGGVDYKVDSKFVPKAEYPRAKTPSVQLCLTKKTKAVDNFVIEGVYDLTKDDYEFVTDQNLRNQARVVAQKILQLKSQKIYDEKMGIFRDTNFSDITILVRSRTGVDVLCEELIACGVPIVASSKQMLCSFAEIAVLVNMLKLLLNKKNDIALVCALSSFFGGLTFDELAKIKIQNRDVKNFCECIEKFDGNDEQIAAKLKRFFVFFDKYRSIYLFEGLEKAVHFLIFESGYFDHCSMQANGLAKSERLKTFFSLVETNSDMQIGWLLDYFDDDKGPVAPNFSTGERDFVGINTIHSSKGLEYPIVILFSCEHKLFSQRGEKLAYSPAFGFATKYVDDAGVEYASVEHEFVKRNNLQQELAEELRLLYVGMTRAKNTLVLSGTCEFEKIEQIQDDEDVFSKSCYLDLILGALDEKTISNIRLSSDCIVQDEQNYYCVELFCQDSNQQAVREKTLPILSKGSSDIAKQLNAYIKFDYSHKNSINLCQKNSVSSLAFDDDLYASKNFSPKKFEKVEHQENFVAANDIGTLYHTIFEKIDLSRHYSIDEINEQISVILNGENEELVDGEKIQKIVNLLHPFISGKIYREKEFIAKIRQNEIVEGGEEDYLVVQGKIDLLILGEKNYIFDYKISKIKDEKILIDKYKKQLMLYKLAVEKAINQKIDDVFVVDVNHNRLIKFENNQ